jgi:quinol monooxygenase YgiN
MGKLVIVAYRPRVGKEEQLVELIKEHMPTLRGEGLVTDRPSQAMRSVEGTIVEIFEWKSQEAIDESHNNEAVKAMWRKFDEVCEYVSLSSLKEAQETFAHFEPIDF